MSVEFHATPKPYLLVEREGIDPSSEDSLLQATTCVSGHLNLVTGDLAGKVPFGPSRFRFRLSTPREGALSYPVKVTSWRLYGHSTFGGTPLLGGVNYSVVVG